MENPDRISQLPDEIIHHILSFISIEKAALTRLLSTRWNSVWSSFPYLTLHISSDRHDYNRVINYIDTVFINRVSTHGICIQRFHLEGRDYRDGVDGYLNWWVELLSGCNVKEVILERESYSYFPKTILSVKSLTMLRLHGFTLSDPDNIELTSLKNLSLTEVKISDRVIQKIFATSLNLENLSIEFCDNLENIEVTGLVQLKLLILSCNHNLMRVKIDAPSLEHFSIYGSQTCEIEFTNCSNLNRLILRLPDVTDEDLSKILSPLNNLKYLAIDEFHALKFPVISSNTLAILEIGNYEGLSKAEINAPNLQSLLLYGHIIFSISTNTNWSNLNRLILNLDYITDEWLSEILLPLHNLKYLKLQKCDLLKFPIISSTTLSVLEISNHGKLSKAEINTPNLQSLKLHGYRIFSISIKTPPKKKAELDFDLPKMGPNQYLVLLGLLRDLRGSESVTMSINAPNIVIPEEWKNHFALMEYFMPHCRDLWMDTNIPLMDGIRTIFPDDNIQNGESSTTYTCSLESLFSRAWY